MEGSSSQYLMHVKREQIMKYPSSHLELAPPIAHDNMNHSWEERAFAEDAARILSGSMWPPRSYSCTFCKRLFTSAQALGGHMNIHRRDRARLKQNLSPHNHKNDYFNSLLLGNHHHHLHHHNHHHEISSTQIDCGFNAYYCSPSTTITSTRLSCMSTQENCGHHLNFSSSSPYSSSCNSEQEGVVNASEYKFNGLGCDNDVETSLSMGVASSMFGRKSSPTITVPCGDRANIGCKRLKTLLHKPCSSVEIPLGLNHSHEMEELDLELRLGKQHKVR